MPIQTQLLKSGWVRTQKKTHRIYAPDAEYCDERVCVSVCVFVCPRSYLRNYTSDLHQFFVHVTHGRGSVLHWRRSDTLYTSGFMDDVISQGCSTSPPNRSAVHAQPLAWL